jgi:hypothetical protein
MRKAVNVPLAAQPAAFRTTDAMPCFTRLPQFPDEMEAIQLPRSAFQSFGEKAKAEGIGFLGGCCGSNAAYIHATGTRLVPAAVKRREPVLGEEENTCRITKESKSESSAHSFKPISTLLP